MGAGKIVSCMYISRLCLCVCVCVVYFGGRVNRTHDGLNVGVESQEN